MTPHMLNGAKISVNEISIDVGGPDVILKRD